MDFGDVIGYGVGEKADFWIAPRSTGEGFRESHIAFAAADRAGVRAFFDGGDSDGSRGAPPTPAVARVRRRTTTAPFSAIPTATTSRP